MYKLLIFAIVAGLVYESHSQEIVFPDDSSEGRTMVEEIIPPVGGVKPCYHPTHIRCWTDWFDEDDPCGRGDNETLKYLRLEHPGKICPNPTAIEVQTLDGYTPVETGDVIHVSDTETGFICRNNDQTNQKCKDYRVRFVCHPPFCGSGICWTKWFDRDNPSGSGDWELLKILRRENPGKICEKPLFIEAATVDTMQPALTTGEYFRIFSPTQGLACLRMDQKDRRCRDYKVRFGCPCHCDDGKKPPMLPPFFVQSTV